MEAFARVMSSHTLAKDSHGQVQSPGHCEAAYSKGRVARHHCGAEEQKPAMDPPQRKCPQLVFRLSQWASIRSKYLVEFSILATAWKFKGNEVDAV